ncbi:MAG: putative beta-lysine N-acetyltransferase [Candidatus Hydrogenedentes bacterium]|nr:putative beta-lysine N-acetyltransferase [Candidatus Hydrogenedentota bacterium]
MKLKGADPEQLVPALNDLAAEKGYTKIFAKVPAGKLAPFTEAGYVEEARIPRFYSGAEDAAFLGYYLDEERAEPGNAEELERVLQLAEQRQAPGGGLDPLAASMTLRPCTPDDVEPMSAIYRTVFPSYPFPIHDTAYLAETMKTDVRYFGILADGGQLVALSSSEMERGSRSVEMTDFATLPDWRGHGFAVHLLEAMESEMRTLGMKTAFTIARAVSPGMNITFAKSGYEYGGRLINNTDISGHIESMNVWHKAL